MGTKTFSQRGIASIIIFIIAFLSLTAISTYVFIKANYKFELPMLTLIIGDLLMLYFVFAMSRLDIIVSNQFIQFKFWNNMLWSEKYKLSDIEACKVITDNYNTGFGMRYLPNGLLYNVSGHKAIELKFHNKKQVVQIGTDKPEEVAAYINSKLNQH